MGHGNATKPLFYHIWACGSQVVLIVLSGFHFITELQTEYNGNSRLEGHYVVVQRSEQLGCVNISKLNRLVEPYYNEIKSRVFKVLQHSTLIVIRRYI